MKKTYKNELPNGLEIEDINVKVENGKLIVDVYFDFHPKDGDFLVSKNDSVFIYKSTDVSDSYGCYCACLKEGEMFIKDSSDWTLKEGCRYATSVEKSEFLRRLEKDYHKKWNAEKKCLEDIYIPKFGDIVKVITDDNQYKRNYMICIYPNKSFYRSNHFFEPPFLTLNGRLILDDKGGSTFCTDIIPASASEKQELFNKLAEAGKKWNPETKQLEDIRWRAKKGKEYYTINGALDVVWEFAGECPHEDVLYNRGNYFRTPEAAQKVVDQIKEILKNSKAE